MTPNPALQVEELKQQFAVVNEEAKVADEEARVANKQAKADREELAKTVTTCKQLRHFRKLYGSMSIEFPKVKKERDNALRQVCTRITDI